jgi:hypothetical protein
MPMTAINGKSGLLSVGFCTESHHRCRVVELNSSESMFYLLNNLLYLNLVILKLKCNNLIFNEIMILNALYVCLLHSRFIENHSVWILVDRPLISEVVLSQ